MNYKIPKYYCPKCMKPLKTRLIGDKLHFGEFAACECGFEIQLWHADVTEYTGGGAPNEEKTT